MFRPLKLLLHGRNSSALQGRWPAGPEGFPAHAAIPHGAQDGHYGRRMAHKRVVTPAWRTKGSLRPPRGRETPSALRGSSPCGAGQSCHLRPIYNKVSSPPHVRIRENPHFFEKKVPESLPESKKWRTFAPAIRKTTCCGKKKRSLKGLHKTRQHKEA